MRKERIWIYSVGILILFSSLASAEFSVGNGSFVEKNYFGGDFVRGKLNISFANQDGNSKFTSNFGGEINLIDILKKMNYVSGREFSCIPTNCKNDYTSGFAPGSNDVEFSLNEKRTYGFKLTGEEVEITGFNFEIFSGAPASCKNQIFIDVFDDGEIDFYNTKYKDIQCGERSFGCFNGDGEVQISEIPRSTGGNRQICEKITLPPAAAYRVGAKVIGTGTETVGVGLYKLNGDPACPSTGDNPRHGRGAVPSNGEVSVIAECQFLEEFKGMVCVVNNGVTDNYGIRFEEDNKACGVKIERGARGGWSVVNVSADYEIFAEPLAYDEFGWVDVNANFLSITRQSLREASDEYIAEIYSRSCADECYIPISFWRGDITDLGLEQIVRVRTSDTKLLKYNTFTASINERKIHELFTGSFTINTENFTSLDIEKMEFAVPRADGNNTFTLKLDDEEVITESLSIKVTFEFDITPRFALIGAETVFVAGSSETINSSIWKFGNGSAVVNSQDNKATHVFTKADEYNIEVELKNDVGASSKRKFKVLVGEPRLSATLLVQEYEARIDNVEENMAGFPEWTRNEISKTLNLEKINGEIIKAKNDLESANTDEELIKIINNLLKIEVPRAVFISEQGDIPGDFGFNNIDVRHIAKISDKTVSDANAVKDGILQWMNENYEINIKFETLSANIGSNDKIIMRIYEIGLTKKNNAGGDFSFLVINQPKDILRFGRNYDVREVLGAGASYIQIDSFGEPSKIEFVISGQSPPSAEALGIYISPVLDDLDVVDKPWGGFREDIKEFLFGRFFIGIIVLLVVFLSVYILLQGWYKRHYEKHLFRHQNDVYNLVNFVYNSRRGGLNDKDIRLMLKDRDWSGEQINYVFKKIDGKRTGMLELPFFKFIENRKVRKEIEKRQGGKPVDARFIKRPGF